MDAFVLPNLEPDKMLLDNSIIGAFVASLYWHTEEFLLPVLVSKYKQRIAYKIPQMKPKYQVPW